MQKIFFTLSLILTSFMLKAQISNPVTWSYRAVKVADRTYDVIINAVIEKNWHIYAQDAGEGPEPTSFSFSKNPLVKLEGKVKEVGKMQKAYDPNFNSTLRFYSNEVAFYQRVKMKSNASTVLKGTVSYMVCDDKKCLPPKDVPFSVKIP